MAFILSDECYADDDDGLSTTIASVAGLCQILRHHSSQHSDTARQRDP